MKYYYIFLLIVISQPCFSTDIDNYDTVLLSNNSITLIDNIYIQKLRPQSKTSYTNNYIQLPFGYKSNNPHNIRFLVKNEYSELRSFVLKITDILLSDCTIHIIRERGDTLNLRNGIYVPSNQKNLNSGLSHEVKFDLNPKESALIQYMHDEYSLTTGFEKVKPKIYNYGAWHRKHAINQLWLHIFSGFIFFQVLVCFSVYYTRVEKSIIFYVLYLICLLGYTFYTSGIFTGVFFESNPVLGEKITRFLTSAAPIPYLLFARSFMRLSLVNKNMDRLFKAVIVFEIIYLMSFSIIGLLEWLTLVEVNYIIYVNNIIFSIPLLFSAQMLFPKNSSSLRTSSKLVIAGFLFMGVIILAGSLLSGFSGNTYHNLQLYSFGFTVEITIVGIALIFRLKESIQEEGKAQESLIAQLKINEQTQKNAQRELKRKVKERTSELAKTTEALKESNNTKDKFFSIIAHDLKSPLVSLKSLLITLNSNYEKFSIEVRENAFNKLNQELHSVSVLLDNLLHWSFEQKKDIEPQYSSVSIHKVIADLILLNRTEIELKQIDVYNDLKEDHTIETDANMLQFILRNLLSNAIKFTPEYGEIKIYSSASNASFCVHFSDSGVGINEADIENIFDISYSKSGTNNEKGSGLGLSLSKEFTEKLGAQLTVINNQNKGSTFTLKLPSTALNTEV